MFHVAIFFFFFISDVLNLPLPMTMMANSVIPQISTSKLSCKRVRVPKRVELCPKIERYAITPNSWEKRLKKSKILSSFQNKIVRLDGVDRLFFLILQHDSRFFFLLSIPLRNKSLEFPPIQYHLRYHTNFFFIVS